MGNGGGEPLIVRTWDWEAESKDIAPYKTGEN
jgi:hypothetical protein